jgi:hypothetical protein
VAHPKTKIEVSDKSLRRAISFPQFVNLLNDLALWVAYWVCGVLWANSAVKPGSTKKKATRRWPVKVPPRGNVVGNFTNSKTTSKKINNVD